jgi:hypothetical protein
MKRLIPVILLGVSIVTGISFLFFVLRMIWFPPASMGMMMGRKMMYHHMQFWFSQMFWILLIGTGTGLLIWIFITRKKKK